MTTTGTTSKQREQATRKTGSQSGQPIVAGVRSDLHTMLLPMFAEQNEIHDLETVIDGCRIRIRSHDAGVRIPTFMDQKIMMLLAAHIRDVIQSGGQPTRHINIDRREVIDLIGGGGSTGGSDYRRVTERLQRLHSTKITAETAISADVSRRRHFSWIDAFEEDILHTDKGKEVIGLKISLSVDAFRWITQGDGFDMTRERFKSITSAQSSCSRIYAICLANLIYAKGEDVYIQIEDLRLRVPSADTLKGFKKRPLSKAIELISASPDMSRYLSVSLVRKTEDGFIPLDGRAPLESVYIRVCKGPDALPSINKLLPLSETGGDTRSLSAAESLVELLTDRGSSAFTDTEMADMS
ncbi:replication initiator protein A [Loktanella sp. DJP18]|uniref:replication initiator protein A n=1 Tax=Loktanella sp. DJP18 TaxID=3409788 RepID=UPI003BB72765